MANVGDTILDPDYRVVCEVVWSGGPLVVPDTKSPVAGCSLGDWFARRRAARVVLPRASRPELVRVRVSVRGGL